MRFRPRKIRIRPVDENGPTGPWRTVGVLKAAEDMQLHEVMPDDTDTVMGLRDWTVTAKVTPAPEVWRVLLDSPAGFPLWYQPPQRALPSVERKALPWGDSCYTSMVYSQVEGWPRMVWGMGPVTAFTPSGEGPRCRARGADYMLRRLGRAIGAD
jgi:hypothetical protein